MSERKWMCLNVNQGIARVTIELDYADWAMLRELLRFKKKEEMVKSDG